MLNESELTRIQNEPTLDDVPRLVEEIGRLQKFISDYGARVTEKMDLIDEGRIQLEAENERLVTAKGLMSIERDACVALVARLALVQGHRTGLAPANAVVVDLPSGQVSWQLQESEAHLLDGLPSYTEQVEEVSLAENYRRVMNPGIGQN